MFKVCVRDVCTLSRHSALRNQGATRRQLNGENFNLNIVKSEVRGMLGHTEAGHPDCGEGRRPFYRTVLKLLIWSEDWQLTEYNWGRGVFVYLLLDPFTSGVVYHCQNVSLELLSTVPQDLFFNLPPSCLCQWEHSEMFKAPCRDLISQFSRLLCSVGKVPGMCMRNSLKSKDSSWPCMRKKCAS